MGISNLLVKVYCDNVGQPVSGVEIEITGNGKTIKSTTDSSGESNLITLECPDKKFSLEPQNDVRPYGTYTVKVSKTGLEDVLIEGIELFDTITSIQEIRMYSDEEQKSQTDYVEIPTHNLWGNYDPKVVVNPFTQISMFIRDRLKNISATALLVPVIPEFIIVHDGLPTNLEAANYYVTFPDYVKNVATSEIYSTWPEETLKANIYAIISFTLNRYYSEWYRSKGYPFTITTSTQFDQKFIKNRNIAESISVLVDSIFNNYIQFGDLPQPFFSQYCDGIKVNNRGWLSQWGSKNLADRGYSAIDILKNYYGDSVSLVSAETVEGIPNSFPGYNLRFGICGDAVQKMQIELNFIGTSYPAIPSIQPAEGVYKEKTEAAVRAFQKIFNLPITGIVDFATWYKISYVFIGVSKMLRGRYEM